MEPGKGLPKAKQLDKGTKTFVTVFWLMAGAALLILLFVAVMYQMELTAAEPEELRTESAMKEIKEEAERPDDRLRRDPFPIGMKKLQSKAIAEKIKGMNIIMAADQKRAAPIIRKMLFDRNAEIRIEAVRLLGNYQVKNAGNYIARLLVDREPRVRSIAAATLPKFRGEPGVMNLVGSALRDRDPAVVKNALSCWAVILPTERSEGVRVLRFPLASTDPEIATAAVSASSPVLKKDEVERLKNLFDKIAARWKDRAVAFMVYDLYFRNGMISVEEYRKLTRNRNKSP
ncbi:MAG: hypothetical protein D6679_04715 [Candidatus Hydrogenedentota bacterium]|nr:MAG: hypothetical protein D6679_04715 [Candidatus Hydrogenedentota bacterium]